MASAPHTFFGSAVSCRLGKAGCTQPIGFAAVAIHQARKLASYLASSPAARFPSWDCNLEPDQSAKVRRVCWNACAIVELQIDHRERAR